MHINGDAQIVGLAPKILAGALQLFAQTRVQDRTLNWILNLEIAGFVKLG